MQHASEEFTLLGVAPISRNTVGWWESAFRTQLECLLQSLQSPSSCFFSFFLKELVWIQLGPLTFAH